MSDTQLPDRPGHPTGSPAAGPSETGAWTNGTDPFGDSQLYDGLIPRRVFAFWIDAVILFAIGGMAWLALGTLVVLSLGLLSPILAVLIVIPITYHSLFVARRGATPGMGFLDLELRAPDGRRPDLARALALTVLFYLSLIPPAWLVLLVPLFNPRRRTLHDWLTGCTMVRQSNWPKIQRGV